MHRDAVQRCGGFGDGRQPGQLGAVGGTVTGDDDRVGGQVDLERDVEGGVHRGGPGLAVGTALGHRALRVELGHERFAQRDVEVDRACVARSGSAGGGENPGDRRTPLAVLFDAFGEAEADGGAHLAAEQPELFDGLVRTGSEQFVGAIGAEHDQRDASIVRLEHGRREVGHGGTGGHDDRDGTPRGEGQADREESGGALVDTHVQAQTSCAVGGLEREGERRVARAGHSTTSRTPPRASSSTTAVAWAVDGFTESRVIAPEMWPGRGAVRMEAVRTVFDPDESSPGRFYRLLTATIVPRPIAWVSTEAEDGVFNLAPYSFFTVASTAPPVVQFTSVGRKDSLRNIEQTGEFVINIATVSLMEKVNASSAAFPHDIDEFTEVGLHAEPSERVRPPRVAEAPASIECRLHRVIEIGDSFVVMGDVLAVTVDSEVLAEDGAPTSRRSAR